MSFLLKSKMTLKITMANRAEFSKPTRDAFTFASLVIHSKLVVTVSKHMSWVNFPKATHQYRGLKCFLPKQASDRSMLEASLQICHSLRESTIS